MQRTLEPCFFQDIDGLYINTVDVATCTFCISFHTSPLRYNFQPKSDVIRHGHVDTELFWLIHSWCTLEWNVPTPGTTTYLSAMWMKASRISSTSVLPHSVRCSKRCVTVLLAHPHTQLHNVPIILSFKIWKEVAYVVCFSTRGGSPQSVHNLQGNSSSLLGWPMFDHC